MPYELPDLAITGQVIAATWGNKNRTNWSLSALGLVTTAGDMVRATGANALERFAAGSNGQILGVTAGVPTWQADTGGASVPWRVQVEPMFWETTVGSWSRQFDTSSQYDFAHIVSQSPYALNNEATYTVVLSAGTWTVQLVHAKHASAAIVSVQLDGVAVGTVDMYSASSLVNVYSSITGVNVAATGKKTLKIKATGKNASSSDYAIPVQQILLLRTV